MANPTTDLISNLQSVVKGRLITSDDSDYDNARRVFSGAIDRRPAVIVRAADDADVARVVTTASDAGVELVVRGGGHSLAGHSASEGGVVLDLTDIRQIDIEVDGRNAWAQAGMTAGDYTAAAGKHGLATGFGDTGSVGISGITLAGGAGFLSRKYGLTVDNLLAAEIVTAKGELLPVDGDGDPELLWAIKGGGGNFGVVTHFKYQLQPVDQFTGGMLILPATADVIAGFVAEAQAAPDELSTIMMAMVAPPMPFLPPQVHGELIVMGLMGFTGPAETAERVLAPFRALATPLADMVQPMPYPQMFPPEEGDFRPIGTGHTMFVDTVDHAAAELILDQIQASTAMVSAVQLRVLGGAISRVPSDATAFAHRERGILVNVNAAYQRAEDASEHQAWVANLAGALSDGKPGAYTGFLGDDGADRMREAYPGPTWDRLVDVKRRYDPTNLFRGNHNIPPG